MASSSDDACMRTGRKLSRQQSDEKVPDSKKRRARLIRLATVRALDSKHENEKQQVVARAVQDVQRELKQLSTRVDDLVTTEIKAKGLNTDAIEFAPVVPATPGIPDGNDEDSQACALDFLYCGMCEKLADACICVQPSLRTIECTRCDFREMAFDTSLKEAIGLIEIHSSSGEMGQMGTFLEEYPRCDGVLPANVNMLSGGEDICECCYSFAHQSTILPCEADNCNSEKWDVSHHVYV